MSISKLVLAIMDTERRGVDLQDHLYCYEYGGYRVTIGFPIVSSMKAEHVHGAQNGKERGIRFQVRAAPREPRGELARAAA